MMPTTWTNRDSIQKTHWPVAFGAFQPTVQLTNNEVHALIRRGALNEWALPADLLIELQKTYPHCEFNNKHQPTKVIFQGESGTRFYEDFEKYKVQIARKKPAPPGP